jgi:hypothetical protein
VGEERNGDDNRRSRNARDKDGEERKSEIQDMAQRHIVGKEAMSRLDKGYVSENTRVVMTMEQVGQGSRKWGWRS